MHQYLPVVVPVAFVSFALLKARLTVRQLLCIASGTALICAFVFLFCTTVIPPNHYAVQYDYRLHAGPAGLTPGRYFVLPPFRSVLAVPAETGQTLESAALTRDACAIQGKFTVAIKRNATFYAQQVEFFGADQLGLFERSLEPILIQSCWTSVSSRLRKEIAGNKEKIGQQLSAAIRAELESVLRGNELPPGIVKVDIEPLDVDDSTGTCKIQLNLRFEQAPHQFVTRPVSGVDTSTTNGDFPFWLFW